MSETDPNLGTSLTPLTYSQRLGLMARLFGGNLALICEQSVYGFMDQMCSD